MPLQITKPNRLGHTKRDMANEKHRTSFLDSDADDVIDPIEGPDMTLYAQQPKSCNASGRYPPNCANTYSPLERQSPRKLSKSKSSESTGFSNCFDRPASNTRCMALDRLPPRMPTDHIFEHPATPLGYNRSIEEVLTSGRSQSDPAASYGYQIPPLGTAALRRHSNLERGPTRHLAKSHPPTTLCGISERQGRASSTSHLTSILEGPCDIPVLPFLQSQTTIEPSQRLTNGYATVQRRRSKKAENIRNRTSNSSSLCRSASTTNPGPGPGPANESDLQEYFRGFEERDQNTRSLIFESHIEKIFTNLSVSPIEQLAFSPQSTLTSLGKSRTQCKASEQPMPLPKIQNVEARKRVSVVEASRGLGNGTMNFDKEKGNEFVRGNSLRAKVGNVKEEGKKGGKGTLKSIAGSLKRGVEKLMMRDSVARGFQSDSFQGKM